MMDKFFSTLSTMTESIIPASLDPTATTTTTSSKTTSTMETKTNNNNNSATSPITVQSVTTRKTRSSAATVPTKNTTTNTNTTTTTNNNTTTTNTTTTQDTAKEIKEDVIDCPLCLNAMSQSDLLYAIHCPTLGCDFNFCSQCIWNLLLSSSQDYQYASDGSKQLKVPLQCPLCRSKYAKIIDKAVRRVSADHNNYNTTTTTVVVGRQIVQDILLCRRAHSLQLLFDQKEDTYTASQLTNKQMFLSQVTWESLLQAHQRLEKYLLEISTINDAGTTITKHDEVRLNYKYFPCMEYLKHSEPLWQQIFSTATNGNSSSSSPGGKNTTSKNSSNGNHVGSNGKNKDDDDCVTLVDPTLLRGLEETMSFSEQQFVTQLLISGQSFPLVQAAQILHGMLTMDPHHVASTRLALARNAANNGLGRDIIVDAFCPNDTTKINTVMTIPTKDIDRYRKLFPPPQLPTWVNVPVYNPFNAKDINIPDPKERRTSRTNILKFNEDTKQINNIRGIPGRLGLRNGDVLTHVNLEPFQFETNADFMEHLYKLYDKDPNATISIVVNATQETAEALQKRSKKVILHLKKENGRGNNQSRPTSQRSLQLSPSHSTAAVEQPCASRSLMDALTFNNC